MKATRLACLSLVLFAPILLAQNNPVPLTYQPLQPTSAVPGGGTFNLNVYGANFVSGSTIKWNGTALATTFVSNSQLTATVPAANIATASTAWVTVTNPTPGGGTSNVQYFTVTNPVTAFDFLDSVLSVSVGTNAGDPNPPPGEVAGDFNNDGKLDLVYLDNTNATVVVLLGNGDGTFKTPVTYPVGSGSSLSPNSTGIIAGDFNGDGNLDLAVADFTGNAVDILLGNGDGTFQTQQSYATAAGPVAIAAADLSQNGILDLAVATNEPTSLNGGFSILMGNGDGTFQTHTDYTLQTCDWMGGTWYMGASAIALGDFNGDGFLDVVISAETPGGFPVQGCSAFMFFPGNGTGTFGNIGQSIPPDGQLAFSLAPLAPPPLGLADSSPIYAVDWLPSGAVWTGNGQGEFSLPSPWNLVGGLSSVVGDFNGDGYLDAALAGAYQLPGQSSPCVPPSKCPFSIVLGSQSGAVSSALVNFIPALGNINGLVAGDFNNDGRMDFASTINGEAVILMQAPSAAAFVSPSSLSSSSTPTVGQTVPMNSPVTLTNGETTLAISSITFSGANAGDFSQTNTCGSSLAPNATCQINVNFTPSAGGTRTATLNVNDNAQNSPQTVGLSGNAVSPILGILPSTINFSSQYVGTAGLNQNVTLTNTGTGALTISSVVASPSSDFSELSTCGNSLAAGGNCSIGVLFDPSASGTRNGVLTLTDNASGSPQTVTLSGMGEDFSLSASSPTATVMPGQTANYSIAVGPLGGFNQAVSMSCSGAPAGATCTVSPSSLTLNGSASQTVTVTVATTASSAMMKRTNRSLEYAFWLAWSSLLGLPIILIKPYRGRKRRSHWIAMLGLICALAVFAGLPACGGGSSSSGGGGVQAGNYSLTVTGSFSSGKAALSHNMTLTLVVQ